MAVTDSEARDKLIEARRQQQLVALQQQADEERRRKARECVQKWITREWL